jgi:hypothetical protein
VFLVPNNTMWDMLCRTQANEFAAALKKRAETTA